MGFALLLVSSFSLTTMGNAPISSQKITDGNFNPVWMIILMQNLMLAHLLFSMSVASVSQRTFNPFRNRLFLVFNIVVIGIYIANFILNYTIDITLCAKILLLVQVIAQSHYFYHVVNQMKTSLRIPIWSTYESTEQIKLGDQEMV